jgi:hypothetical protein
MPPSSPDMTEWRNWTLDDIEWYVTLPPPERVEVARRMSAGVKLALGGMLFDRECEIITDRIRVLLPEASQALVNDLLRLAVAPLHDSQEQR